MNANNAIPFFILSSQKSGSTWFRASLEHHPNIQVKGELHISRDLWHLEKIRGGNVHDLLAEKGTFEEIIQFSVNLMIRNRLGQIEEHTRFIGDKSAVPFEWCVNDRLHPRDYLCILQRHFPESKKIIVVRDLRDVIVSYDAWAKGQRLLGNNPLNLFRFVKVVIRWSQMNSRWYSEAQSDPNCIVIRFEDMKVDFKETLHKVFEHFGVECGEGYLDKLLEERYSINAPQYKKQNKKQGYSFFRSGKTGQWKKKFSWHHVLIVKLVAHHTMSLYGYKNN